MGKEFDKAKELDEKYVMHTFVRKPVEFVGGAGQWLFDEEGNEYLDFLSGYRFDPSELKITQNGSHLDITIEGYWYKTILWEVPLMAIISELYFKMTNLPIHSQQQIEQRAHLCRDGRPVGSHFFRKICIYAKFLVLLCPKMNRC